jgi:sugar (pentulose or hexulose) kinase
MKTDKNGLIIALDFGTSNLKGAVYDLNGKELAYKAIEYNLYTPLNSIVENNVNLYWDNIIIILKDLSEKLGSRSKEVLAIGTSSQGETIVPVDNKGNTLRNAIVWIDSRTTAEATEIAQSFDSKKMYRMTGYPEVGTSWPATSKLWSQIKSDICGLRIMAPEYNEMALLGSAVITSTAIGLFSNISEADKNLVNIKDTFLPDDSKKQVYAENFYKYKTLYKSLKDLF